MVSVDEGGTVCLWNLEGGRQSFFHRAHGSARVTAVAFDAAQRRLLTGSSEGSVRMWNFNNGFLLREFVHKDESSEVSALLFAHDPVRESNEVTSKITQFCISWVPCLRALPPSRAICDSARGRKHIATAAI